LFDTLSVRDNLLVGVGIVASAGSSWGQAASTKGTPAEAVEEILERFDLQSYRDMSAGTLPEGVRKLLDIAMAMVAQPRILLLDEPTSGVSAEEKFVLMDLVMEAVRSQKVTVLFVEAVRSQKVTVLFVEHDMEIVNRYTHRVLAFSEGRIIADDEPEVALNDPEVRKHIIGETLHVKRGDGHAAA
jgi:branched-chain amino acid transport system ATP-binding protein